MDIQKDTPSKQRILETGVAMFASKGFDGTGMRELAEHAGVNLAMINYFFGTKKGLLKVILDTFFSQYVEIAEQEFQSEGTMDEKIQRFIRRIIPFVSDNQDYLIVVLTELPHDDPDIIEHKLKWIKKIISIVQSEICEPLSEDYNCMITPAELGPILLGMIAMRFLVDPLVQKLKSTGQQSELDTHYPELVSRIFLQGIHGLKNYSGGVVI